MKLVAPNITKLPDGRFEVRVSVLGRRRRRRFATKTEAQRYLDASQRARTFLGSGLEAPPEAAPALGRATTLDGLFAGLVAFQRAAGRSPKTITQTLAVQKLWVDALGGAHPVPLSEEEVLRGLGSIRSRPSRGAATRGRSIEVALQILRTAHRKARIPVPPTPQLPVERRPRPVETIAGAAAFLAALPMGSVERAHAEILLRTGCRESEARRLLVGDVDVDAGVITFRRRKGWRARGAELIVTTPMGAGLRQVLEAYTKRMGERPAKAPFLVHEDGGELGEQTLRKRYLRASKVAKIPERNGIAWLRNQAATLAGDAGVPMEVTRRVMGHASITTTEKHYDRSELRKARSMWTEKLDELVPVAAAGPKLAATRKRKFRKASPAKARSRSSTHDS